MGTPMEMAALITVVALLIGASVLGGALWAQARSMPRVRALRLAEQLAALSRTLELLVARLENVKPVAAATEPEKPHSSPANHRVDRAAATAVAGPTLIAVPDLARPATSPPNVAVADELARRFSHVWALADAGRTVEAIARETSQPIGHVELILGLRRQVGQDRASRSSLGGRPS